MSWSPVPYVTPSIGYSENREESTGQDDKLNRLYSVTVSTRPLPSVNFSLGYTHNDRYEDKDKTYQADTYSLFAKASIYPDLSVSLNNSYSVTDTLDRASAEEFFRQQQDAYFSSGYHCQAASISDRLRHGEL